MSTGAIIAVGALGVMVCCSSSVAAMMMGGDDESNVGKVCTPQGTPDPNATYKYGANDVCLMTCKTGYKKKDGACVEKTLGPSPSGGSPGPRPGPPPPPSYKPAIIEKITPESGYGYRAYEGCFGGGNPIYAGRLDNKIAGAAFGLKGDTSDGNRPIGSMRVYNVSMEGSYSVDDTDFNIYENIGSNLVKFCQSDGTKLTKWDFTMTM